MIIHRGYLTDDGIIEYRSITFTCNHANSECSRASHNNQSDFAASVRRYCQDAAHAFRAYVDVLLTYTAARSLIRDKRRRWNATEHKDGAFTYVFVPRLTNSACAKSACFAESSASVIFCMRARSKYNVHILVPYVSCVCACVHDHTCANRAVCAECEHMLVIQSHTTILRCMNSDANCGHL